MNLIVNGDDFGYDQTVNESMADLIARRRITSATLIANAPALEDAVRRIPRGSHCSFGAHLNLTEFEPLTHRKKRGILSLCLDEKGCFYGEDHLRTIRMTAPLREAIFEEWRLQVETILKLGIRVSHFDSHNHVHTIPGLFPVLKRLQAYFSIRKVRTTWNIFTPQDTPPWLRIQAKRLWDNALRYYYATTTASGFTSLATFIEVAKTRRLNFDSVELMVHPGHQAFRLETEVLNSDWSKALPFPVRLISYRDI